jgi:hypothetical protein
MTGHTLAVHQPESNYGLGIRTISVSPSTKQIACAMFDSQVYLYNNQT